LIFCTYSHSINRDAGNEKIINADEDVDSGVDGETGSDSPAKVEENTTPEKQDEPAEDADYELIESVVHKGKMIKRQLSVQSHSKSVADLFSVNSQDDSNMSITGRKVSYF